MKLFSQQWGARKCHGFSLLELLLVFILLAVIAGISIPSFNQTYKNFQLSETANRIAYLMRFAQSRSVTQAIKHRLEFTSDLSSCWISKNTSDTEELDVEDFKRIDGRFGRSVKIPEGIELDFNERHIEFFIDGKMDKVRVYVCKNEQCITISTQEQSGYVQVYEYRLQ